MTTLITIQFSKYKYGNCVKSTDRTYSGASNGSFASTKKKLVKSLKARMQSFYPGHTFIFNFKGVS